MTTPTTSRAFAQADALVDLVADAVDVEDALGDDRAAHQGAEVGADERDDRDQRVAQQVDADHPAPGQALGGRGADVVGADVLGQVGARSAGRRRPASRRPAPRPATISSSTGASGETVDREPARLDAEEELEQSR